MLTPNSDYEMGTHSRRGSHRHSSRPSLHAGIASPGDLLSLPVELHYLILAQLDLGDLLQLRRSNRFYHQIINANFLRQRFIRNDRASPVLIACCNQCLCAPGLNHLVLDQNVDTNLWQSVCFRCWSARITMDYHLNPWPVVRIANGDEGYICQFCNWPVVNCAEAVDRLHAKCRSRRRFVLLVWLMMAFLQFGIGVVCAVLAWTRYKSQIGVLIPSSIDFVLAMISVVVFIFRICTNNERKYVRLLFTELILTILRIPPVAYTAHTTVVYKLQQGLLPKFGFGIFVINLFHRSRLAQCWLRPSKIPTEGTDGG
ncbi:hypothetical protein GGR50DRAFT_688590 [Xylaria sp. CBS 124048]|nr:hypothetical protein GGR50DRAFT_688590 [Xylaria sp. CBS 124048]